jgi:hypothetical protein
MQEAATHHEYGPHELVRLICRKRSDALHHRYHLDALL